jgi:CRISPR-associated protein Cas1
MAANKIEKVDPATKRQFSRLIAFDLQISGEVSPLSVAAIRLAQSLARAFETGRADLALFDPPTPMEWATAGQLQSDDGREQ